MGREDEIRIIAYGIWETDQYRHGCDFDHWLRAEVIWEKQHKPAAPPEKVAQPVDKSPSVQPTAPTVKPAEPPPARTATRKPLAKRRAKRG